MERGKKFTKGTFVIHPDIQKVTKNYKGDRNVFSELFEERNEMVRRGEVFWETDHDEEMKETAEQRTQQAAMEGWVYPTVRRRK